MLSRAKAGRVRWTILALLVGFSAVSYVERINLSVAGRFVRDDLGLTDVHLGWVFSAFLIAYTLGQIPSGMLSDRYGPHRVLTCAALLWFVLTIALAAGLMVPGLAPALATAWLVGLRFLLGLAEAPTYPAATRVVASWFPEGERATANAVIQSASYAGSALTLPLMTGAVLAWGWQPAMFLSAIPALLLGLLWWRHATDDPSRHRRIGPAEKELIGTRERAAPVSVGTRVPLRIVLDRSVLWLSASYFCQGYVLYLFFFWFYTYLVDARGFSIASSGWTAALPTVAAAVAALAGGTLSNRLAARSGALPARRRIILWSGVVGAASLLAGAFAAQPVLAVAGFTLAIATRGLVEASYWTLAIEANPRYAGTVGGVMNTASNVGGAASTALAPVVVAVFDWPVAIALAAVVTLLGGICVLGVRASGERRGPDAHVGTPAPAAGGAT